MASRSPAYCMTLHNVGRLVLAVNNNGTFGSEFSVPSDAPDCFTGQTPPPGGCQYPKGTGAMYMFSAAFWIGAVLGRDTLVSTGSEGWSDVRQFFPNDEPFGNTVRRSIIDPESEEYVNAVSEQDFIALYTDTSTILADAEEDGTAHRPLNIQVTQRSYAWSYDYADDIILFDYEIKNIGNIDLRNVYMGVYVDADVCDNCQDNEGFADDICGFLVTYPREYGRMRCEYNDTVYIAWIADNDGDFNAGEGIQSTPHVTGTRIVRTPADTLDVSFNWWVSNGNAALDFGPREKDSVGRWKEPYRDFRTGGTGTPVGDRNRYYSLRNREFDYDQIFTNTIREGDPSWIKPPSALAPDIADGFDTRYLLSFGPFNIRKGQKLPLSFAYVAGADLHRDPDNGDNLLADPVLYYSNLYFDSLAENATWASWIYDNPGVDSDSDGYSGKFRCMATLPDGSRICLEDCDTTAANAPGAQWEVVAYMGDGIPDFRGARPPDAPRIWLEPKVGQIRVRFNGKASETGVDRFSGLNDFEGYRIYLGRDNRETSFSVLASYDRHDFNKWDYDLDKGWQLNDPPYTLDSLRALFQDPTLDPGAWTFSRAYTPAVNPDPRFPQYYFAAQDYNVSDLTNLKGIHKIYPDQPYPSSLIPSEADPSELTPDGFFKYFEYEYIIDSLLPTVPYYVNVTAFDYGSPSSGLSSLETSKTVGSKMAYPLATAQAVEQENLDVIVYPNPYRSDGGYRALGFEGRGADDINRPDSRVRDLHFANLPAKCTIRIYTLDGDLVREIKHDMDPSDPNASHDSWDLITRNTQMVVSGLYYWTVEDEEGNTQMGKVAIIM
ncbi:MAG TPA: hypothetical protein PK186_12930 [candidate division Zixibacteria bacterium]|nr:hypothetical protein [candidate division Zixibacteria bacterium]MDD4918628.1 hypothetical protein [candidate division Zixibacteria bacterium]MDM7972004.1 hypothetical protein [candidate division Zixibacteria bacterium]HOD66059.1 hypothetical protein [candidate division Zixibacteria bacterium]HPM38452.1 hypothetical protein [candidate division Zixibacteria bacterium]